MKLSPDLKARVLRAARTQPAPTRAETRRRQWALLGPSAGAALAIFLLWGGVHVESRPTALVIATAAGSGVIAAVALWLTFTRGRSMLGRPRAVLLALALAAPAALVAWKYGISWAFDMAERWPTRPGLRCLGMSLLMGTLPLVASLLARARSDPARPAATGASLGVAVGVGVALLVDLWCPVAYLPHLLVGHVLPMAILGAAGALLGARIVGVRS